MTVGKTRDAGWQIGASRTLDYPLDRVWSTLVESPDLWLGPGAVLPREVGQPWTASDGRSGQLRSRREHDRVRLTMRRPDDPHETTVQVAVRPIGRRTTLRFHQERMRDADERAAQRTHWQAMLDRISATLAD